MINLHRKNNIHYNGNSFLGGGILEILIFPIEREHAFLVCINAISKNEASAKSACLFISNVKVDQ